jgi:hypothetical protein
VSDSILLTDTDAATVGEAVALLDGWRAEQRALPELASALSEPGVRALLLTTNDPSLLRSSVELAHARGVPVLVGCADETGRRRAVELKAEEWFLAHSAGSGPFTLKSYTSGSELRLARNDSYWGKDKAAFPKVVMKQTDDAVTQRQQLEQGAVDIAMQLSPDVVKDMSTKGLSIEKVPSFNFVYLALSPGAKGGEKLTKDTLEAIRLALDRSEAVIVCGGLGPTQDDITREAIAEIMGVELVRDDEIVAKIEAMFARRGRPMAANNLRQADVPVGATTIDQIGTAPGYNDSENDHRVNVEACRELGIRSVIAAPLNHLNRVLGILQVLSSEAYAFDDRDVATVQLLSNLMVMAFARRSDGPQHIPLDSRLRLGLADAI